MAPSTTVTLPKLAVVWSTVLATLFGTGGTVGLVLTALQTGHLSMLPTIFVGTVSTILTGLGGHHAMSVVAHKIKTQNEAISKGYAK